MSSILADDSKPAVRVPGRVRVVLMGLCAVLAATPHCPGLLALGLGAAFGCSGPVPVWAGRMTRWLLAASVVGLGFGMSLAPLLQLGLGGVAQILACVVLTLGLGLGLGRLLGIHGELCVLLSAGTAICGGSAVAALAPVLRARPAHIAASLGVVYALNAAGMLFLPTMAAAADLPAEAAGRWCALAIHDTASVLGAAAELGDESLRAATVAKMARALAILPLVLGVALFRRSSREQAGRPRLPWFVLYFLAAAALVSALPQLQPLGRQVAGVAKAGMSLALFCAGLGLNPGVFRAVPGRVFGFGLLLWLALLGCSWLLL